MVAFRGLVLRQGSLSLRITLKALPQFEVGSHSERNTSVALTMHVH